MIGSGGAWKSISLSMHARLRMAERGATEGDVIETILRGAMEPAMRGLTLFRRNHPFNALWAGKRYAIKQVACIVATEADRLTVVTVYTFYFQEGSPA
jgi:hypothetical protein